MENYYKKKILNGKFFFNFKLKKKLLSAKIIYVGQSKSKFNTDLIFNINDNEFIEFVKNLSKKPLSDITRIFFGIALSHITNESIKQYRKVI